MSLDYTSTAVCGKSKRTSSAHNRKLSRVPQGPVRASVAVIAVLTMASFSVAQAPATGEYEVKAAFLFHFAQFVEWPEAAFHDANSPLTYCTIGEDAFHGSLDAALRGKMTGARAFRVEHINLPQEIQGCQVLFIGTKEKKLLPAILAGVKENAILTVGESEHFVQEGGMIGFLLDKNKVGFEINLEAAQKAKLRVSSKLLALAKKVVGGQKGT